MATKILVLALVLLLPNVVSAEAEAGTEGDAEEPCDIVEASANPPDLVVQPECLHIWLAEESK